MVQSVEADMYKELDGRTHPRLNGPNTVDSFQVSTDVRQALSPVKYRVEDVKAKLDLGLVGAEVVEENGVEYYGRYVKDASGNDTAEIQYLTYPTPAVYTIFVPSTRTDNDTYNQLTSDLLYGTCNVDDVFFGYKSISGVANNIYVDTGDANSLPRLVSAINLTEYEALQSVIITADDPDTEENEEVNAYTKLSEHVSNLQSNLEANASSAIDFVKSLTQNSDVPKALRTKLYDLWMSSTNRAKIMTLQGWYKLHASMPTKNSENVYGTSYDFSQIKKGDKKLPIITLPGWSQALPYVNVFAAELASWGFAAIVPQEHYQTGGPLRVPGKTATIRDLISADVVDLKHSFVDYRFAGFTGSYDVIPEGGPGTYTHSSRQTGCLSTMRYQWLDPKLSRTGNTGLDYLRSMYEGFRHTISNAFDVNGANLAELIDLDNMGSSTHSGDILSWGANQYNTNMLEGGSPSALSLKCIFGNDNSLMNYDYGVYGFFENDENFISGPQGFSCPVMMADPDSETYYPYYDSALYHPIVVGRRIALQKMFRKTHPVIRRRSYFVETPIDGHFGPLMWWYTDESSTAPGFAANSSKPFYNYCTDNVVEHLHNPSLVGNSDPVHGCNSTEGVMTEVRHSLIKLQVLWFRYNLLKDIPNFNMLLPKFPIKYDKAPWTIPGFDDYSWSLEDIGNGTAGFYDSIKDNPKHNTVWEQDLGGKFKMFVDGSGNLIIG